MLGLFEGILGKILGSGVSLTFSKIYKFFAPAKIAIPKFPQNFFQHIGLGTSSTFITSTLGPPHQFINSTMMYDFDEVLCQIELNAEGSAKSICLALTNSSPKTGFPLSVTDKPLGKLTFDEFIPFEGEMGGVFEFRRTLTTWELLYKTQFPPHSLSSFYTFGALNAKFPGKLLEPKFDEVKAEINPREAAHGTLINWVGVSSISSEELFFDHLIGLRL